MIFNKVVYVAAPKVQLAAPSDLIATPGTGKISLTWTDPEDIVRTGKTVATWAKTRIVRKEGAPPNDHNDGVIVVESTEKNQYQSTPYDDSTVQVGTVYHYGAFSYSEEGVWSEGAFANATPIAGTPLSSLAVGTVVKIAENGTPAEYIVVNQGIPGKSSLYDNSCDGVWMLRLNIYADVQWSSAYNDYAQSYVNGYLNSSFLEMFSDYVQSIIHQVKVPYRPGAGGSFTASTGENGLSTKVFLPSAAEVSFYNSRMPRNEGAELSFFVGCADDAPDSKRSASLNGQLSEWWLRTPYCSNGGSDNDAWRVAENGSCHYPLCSSPSGVRPVIILPFSALVDQDLNLIEEVSA